MEFTEQQVHAACAAHESGVTQTLIGNFFGCSRNTIRRLLQRQGVPLRARPLGEIDAYHAMLDGYFEALTLPKAERNRYFLRMLARELELSRVVPAVKATMKQYPLSFRKLPPEVRAHFRLYRRARQWVHDSQASESYTAFGGLAALHFAENDLIQSRSSKELTGMLCRIVERQGKSMHALINDAELQACFVGASRRYVGSLLERHTELAIAVAQSDSSVDDMLVGYAASKGLTVCACQEEWRIAKMRLKQGQNLNYLDAVLMGH